MCLISIFSSYGSGERETGGCGAGDAFRVLSEKGGIARNETWERGVLCGLREGVN